SRTASFRPPGDREPFLSARAGVAALSDGRFCDDGHDHRLASHHFRRLLADPAAIQLGFLPRMRVLHTASHEKGQIYMPVVNWLLAAGTLGAVIGFASSDALGGAYGIAVSMLMALETVLAALVALQWGYNPLLVAAVNGVFLVV